MSNPFHPGSDKKNTMACHYNYVINKNVRSVSGRNTELFKCCYRPTANMLCIYY